MPEHTELPVGAVPTRNTLAELVARINGQQEDGIWLQKMGKSLELSIVP